MRRVHLLVFGSVQGVGFRYSVIKKAEMLNITGWVRNNPDESVEIVAEGDDKFIAAFVNFCKKGPSSASVTEVKIFYEEVIYEFKKFGIKF